MARISPEPDQIYFEDILAETGWGLYYKVLLGLTSASAFCQGVAGLCLSLALPLATCESLLTENTILTGMMCFYFGKALGGFLLNGSADISGKLWFIPNSLIIIFGSTFIAAFSHGTTTMLIAAFILGSGLEASCRCTKIHFSEILPKRSRGFYLIVPGLFWTLGYLTITLISWGISKHVLIEHDGMDLRLTAWRLIFTIVGGFNIIVACASALAQPSPRFLLFKKQNGLAISTLKQLYAVNKSKYSETWPINEQELNGLISDFQINTEPEPINCTEQMQMMTKRMFKTTCLLFKRRFIASTVTLILAKIVMFTGIFPLHVWLAQRITSIGNVNKTCTIFGDDLLYLYKPITENCKYNVDFDLLMIFVLLTVNIFIGQLTTLFMIDRIGRRFIVVMGSTLCSFASLSLGYWNIELQIVTEYIGKLVLVSIFLLGYTMVDETINVITIEMYPTAMRGTAAGVLNFYPNFLFCLLFTLLNVSCQYMFLYTGFVLLGATALAYFIPELANRPMVE